MDAKQTMSASLVGLLGIASPALGDESSEPPGEVQPKTESLKMRQPTGTFQIGAGYSTDDGFIATMRIAQPRLFGTDKGLLLSGTISDRWREALVRYDDPTLFDSDLRLRLRGEVYMRAKHYTGFTREAVGGQLTLTKRIAPHLDAFVGYKLEHVTIAGDRDIELRATQDIPRRGDYVLGSLTAGFEYATIAEEARVALPRRGSVVGAAVEYADEALGSDVGFVRAAAWLAHHQPLGPFTLHLGGRASAVPTSVEGIPISERLHFDGSADVRGFAPGSIVETGGNLQWSGRAELETPSCQGISLAGFVDAGGLYADGEGGEVASAGVGIIWRSPIGPLRFDWAKPLVGDDRDLRFVFGIGGVF